MSVLLSTRELALHVGGLDILTDVSLELRAGETLGLIGPNGAGKTTIVKLIARLYDPTEGRILMDGKDLKEYADLVAVLEQKVGRLIINGYPTGVEVCHAMVHGGPFPATTDSRSTSVGTGAITRFTRPVCYQNFPTSLLPAELQDGNPLGIWRLVNGDRQKN